MPDHQITATLLDPQHRDLESVAGAIGHTRMFSNAKAINEAERTIDFICSSATIDRYGEIVEPAAFAESLPAFMQNPVFPFGHHYDAAGDHLPTVGHWRSMRVVGDQLIGTAYFKRRGLGEQCWQDYLEGNLTSVSVAFLSRSWEMRELDLNGSRQRVRVHTKADLLECSAVLIPANPQARIRAASAFAANNAGGIDPEHLETMLGNALSKLLDTSPGGRLSTLIADVVASVNGPRGFGGEFSDDAESEPEEPDNSEELKNELQRIARHLPA